MLTSPRSSIALALFFAAASGLFELELALAGAKPYESLWVVQMGALTGMIFGYAVVFLATARACRTAAAVASPARRFTAFVAVGLLSAAAAFLAPLLPSAVLASTCKIDALCPSAANPVLWSFLNLVTGFANMPSLVIVAVVAVFAIHTHKLRRSEHVA